MLGWYPGVLVGRITLDSFSLKAQDPGSALRKQKLTSNVRSCAPTEALARADREERIEHVKGLLDITEAARRRILQELVEERKGWALERATLQSQADIALAQQASEISELKQQQREGDKALSSKEQSGTPAARLKPSRMLHNQTSHCYVIVHSARGQMLLGSIFHGGAQW